MVVLLLLVLLHVVIDVIDSPAPADPRRRRLGTSPGPPLRPPRLVPGPPAPPLGPRRAEAGVIVELVRVRRPRRCCCRGGRVLLRPARPATAAASGGGGSVQLSGSGVVGVGGVVVVVVVVGSGGSSSVGLELRQVMLAQVVAVHGLLLALPPLAVGLVAAHLEAEIAVGTTSIFSSVAADVHPILVIEVVEGAAFEFVDDNRLLFGVHRHHRGHAAAKQSQCFNRRRLAASEGREGERERGRETDLGEGVGEGEGEDVPGRLVEEADVGGGEGGVRRRGLGAEEGRELGVLANPHDDADDARDADGDGDDDGAPEG
ncbi:hypothetical protein EUGRSUZ_E00111 [Eucalyptus grandis]|uniref:Uncharacterized protein n=2 Tax=Eucalyptus grandis TaxID=71139 RepID=A0ACC3KRB3_EUCGR|nr:hypothetical protein EUGRSUZ_E00111 [Eucalyptus grandis]